jgi:hypothetical protein
VNKVKVVAAVQKTYRADDCLSGKVGLSDTQQIKQIYQTKNKMHQNISLIHLVLYNNIKCIKPAFETEMK